MIDVVPNAGVIALGKQGENQAVRVTLPNIRAGSGSILLLHQRSDDQKPYPVPVLEADGGIIWTVSSTDTAYPGRGQAELQWLGADGAVVKSVTYQTNTIRALTTPGAVPDEPLKPYTQAVARDAQTARDAAASATEAARSAGSYATQAGLSAATATEAASNAGAIVGQAGQAAQSAKVAALAAAQNAAAAETAEEAAKQAKTGAEEAKTEAQTAKTAAEKAAQEAKTAQAGAIEARTEAEAAQAKAEEAAQEAQKVVEAAVLYTEQNLTDSQQEQARSNISAADKSRQNILVGTETGNTIAVDDAFSAPLCGLTVYGNSTQDGTPSPDNPVQIVSAGDSGSVIIKMMGKNLLDFLHAEITKAGWQGRFTRDEEILTVRAINGWGAFWFVSPVRGKQISVSFAYRQIDNKTDDTIQAFSIGTSDQPKNIVSYAYSTKTPEKIWTKIDCTMISKAYVGVMLRVKNEGVNEERTIEIKDFQLELGSTATVYSPYRKQLLTLPTPNGLPGIPVTSGGSYTDQNGQQWICDEVALERGVRVQRVDKAAFDNTKTLAEQNAILSAPIETPLTLAEIAAYKALTAYAPDTVVQASDGTGAKLDYQRDVNIAIKKLEDTIASMTAN